jgi:hypothetical protein
MQETGADGLFETICAAMSREELAAVETLLTSRRPDFCFPEIETVAALLVRYGLGDGTDEYEGAVQDFVGQMRQQHQAV